MSDKSISASPWMDEALQLVRQYLDKDELTFDDMTKRVRVDLSKEEMATLVMAACHFVHDNRQAGVEVGRDPFLAALFKLSIQLSIIIAKKSL